LGVATQGGNRTRSLVWEDEAPAETRFRRVQQAAPSSSRNLPFEVDDDDPGESRRKRFAAPKRPWWRPESAWGRAALGCGLFVVVCVFAYGFYLCKTFFEHDARFRIAGTGNIEAVGLAEVNRSEILPIFGEDIGRNIFFVPLAERRKQLEQIPWVQRATVMRLLPDEIRVAIVERQPVAFVRHGQQIGLVDADGVLLNMPAGLMSQHHYSFPVLTGIDAADPLPSRKARVGLYQRFMSELDANGQHFSEQISEIDLTDPEDARVLMPEQGSDVLAHFGEDHFLERYQRYKAHIAEWKQQYPKLAGVDLRYDQQVVLQMTHGGDEAQAPVMPSEPKLTAAQPAASVEASAKPDPAKHIASVAPTPTIARTSQPEKKPIAARPVSAKPDVAKTAAKPAVAHAVASAHGKAKTAAQAKKTNAKSKDKKHAQIKKVAQKPKAKPHASAATTVE
jgi:cell division protein FtsQ